MQYSKGFKFGYFDGFKRFTGKLGHDLNLSKKHINNIFFELSDSLF